MNHLFDPALGLIVVRERCESQPQRYNAPHE